MLKERAAATQIETRNLQRAYLDFLEALALREERIPCGRGEVVYYNLGKFSQVISDFEEIHFTSIEFATACATCLAAPKRAA